MDQSISITGESVGELQALPAETPAALHKNQFLAVIAGKPAIFRHLPRI